MLAQTSSNAIQKQNDYHKKTMAYTTKDCNYGKRQQQAGNFVFST